MSTTTVGDLLARTGQLTRTLAASLAEVSAAQWNSFDATLYQLLSTLNAAMARPRAHRVHPDHPRRGQVDLLADYPDPLRPPLRSTSYTVAEAAALLHVSARTITTRARAGTLRGHRDADGLHIDVDQLHKDNHVPLAESADTHPLARLADTLGALNDILARVNTPSRVGLQTIDAETAASIAARVLSVAAVAARHALDHGPIAVATRPLQIAQYADRAYDRLSEPGRAWHLPTWSASSPPDHPQTLAERLEAAAVTWAAAARADLGVTVPSLEVLRNVLNQAAHAHAVTAILDPFRNPQPSTTASGALHERTTFADADAVLRDGVGALRHADVALTNRTTAMRPSHEYAAAARQLYLTLAETRAMGADLGRERTAATLDRAQILRVLATVNDQAHAILQEHRNVPEALIRARLLYAPARTLRPTADRLTSRIAGRLTAVDLADEPDLTTAIRSAEQALRHTAVEVFHPLVRETISPSWTPSPL